MFLSAHHVWIRDADELLLPPYAEELALCDFLSNYLRGIQRASGEADEAHAQSDGATLDAKKLGGMTMIRNELEDYSINTTKKRGKKRGSAKCSTDKIKHSVESLDYFSSLSLAPTATHADISAALDRLAAKKVYFQTLERGAVKSMGDKRKEKERESSNVSKQFSSSTAKADNNGGGTGAVVQRAERKEKKGSKGPTVFSLDADFPSLDTSGSPPAATGLKSNQEPESEPEVQ